MNLSEILLWFANLSRVSYGLCFTFHVICKPNGKLINKIKLNKGMYNTLLMIMRQISIEL